MNWKAVTKVVKKASRAGEKTLRRAEKETSRVAKKALIQAEKEASRTAKKATKFTQEATSATGDIARQAATGTADFLKSKPGKKICGDVGATLAIVLIPEGGPVSAKVGRAMGEKAGEEVSKGLRQV